MRGGLAAGGRAGEILWRLPLHPEYAELIKGRYGDIVNAVENRRAASVTAAEFLHRFVGDVPWAHLDIAGVAWDTGKDTPPRAARATASACSSSSPAAAPIDASFTSE